MAILFYYISEVIAQKCGENNKAVRLRLLLTFSKTFSILRNILPWHSKKIVHLHFSVYSKLS